MIGSFVNKKILSAATILEADSTTISKAEAPFASAMGARVICLKFMLFLCH